jgi:hypothetical protein
MSRAKKIAWGYFGSWLGNDQMLRQNSNNFQSARLVEPIASFGQRGPPDRQFLSQRAAVTAAIGKPGEVL